MRSMSMTALAFGLVATGALSLAVATDYWLFTEEHMSTYMDYQHDRDIITVLVKTHSGLWRACSDYNYSSASKSTTYLSVYRLGI